MSSDAGDSSYNVSDDVDANHVEVGVSSEPEEPERKRKREEPRVLKATRMVQYFKTAEKTTGKSKNSSEKNGKVKDSGSSAETGTEKADGGTGKESVSSSSTGLTTS